MLTEAIFGRYFFILGVVMQYLPYVFTLLVFVAVLGMCLLVVVMRASHRQHKAACAKVDHALDSGARVTQHRIEL